MLRHSLKLKNSQGQMTVEAVLLIVVLFGVSVMVSDFFKDRKIFATLISGPWNYVDGMIQAGNWAPKAQALAKHPNLRLRHATPRNDSFIKNPDSSYDDKASKLLELN